MKVRVSHYLGHQTLLDAQINFLLFFVQIFLFDFGKVDGRSMEPTLIDQQSFLVNRIALFFRQPRRYEVIQLFHPLRENEFLVKRVIGLPGEIVEIQSDKIKITTINGEVIYLSEMYLPKDTRTLVKPGWHIRFAIPFDSYFVLGDNRTFSIDSREFGSVHRKYIIGTIYFRSKAVEN